MRLGDRYTHLEVDHVSIHAPREGCDYPPPYGGARKQIVSIHAPREGCDRLRRPAQLHPRRFNSRTPGGVRRSPTHSLGASSPFQFTHPGRGATAHCIQSGNITYVSIHAPREGCDVTPVFRGLLLLVSIHAPREGCDISSSPRSLGFGFQFTHPGRGATRAGVR